MTIAAVQAISVLITILIMITSRVISVRLCVGNGANNSPVLRGGGRRPSLPTRRASTGHRRGRLTFPPGLGTSGGPLKMWPRVCELSVISLGPVSLVRGARGAGDRKEEGGSCSGSLAGGSLPLGFW